MIVGDAKIEGTHEQSSTVPTGKRLSESALVASLKVVENPLYIGQQRKRKMSAANQNARRGRYRPVSNKAQRCQRPASGTHFARFAIRWLQDATDHIVNRSLEVINGSSI